MSENATIAERIRFYRTKRGMTCDTLAERVGQSRHGIMYYENNEVEPSLDNLKSIAGALDIKPDMLFDDYYRFLDYPYSDKIKQIRAERHLPQREFGEMLGVDRRTVERWEHGRHIPPREILDKLKALKFI